MKFSSKTNQKLIDALTSQFNSFYTELQNRNVASKRLETKNIDLPVNCISFESLNQHINENIQPNLSASNGGRYWGGGTGGANPVATYADWLVAIYNQNVSKGGDSIASSIEQQALIWLCQLFELPSIFKGLFTTGATAANLLAAITARQYVGKLQGINIAKAGMNLLDVNIFSATHMQA